MKKKGNRKTTSVQPHVIMTMASHEKAAFRQNTFREEQQTHLITEKIQVKLWGVLLNPESTLCLSIILPV